MSAFEMKAFEGLFSKRNDDRSDLVYMARTSEAAERYDDMCKFMSKLVQWCKANSEALTVEERNLLSVAYKNVIGARRASWRTINAESSDSKTEHLVKEYKGQIESEVETISQEVLTLLKDFLINDEETEAQVFYKKMAGDYYRYLAECVTEGDFDEQATKYYSQAFEIATKQLEATHPIRLGLALNYSVCEYEIRKNQKGACTLAKDAFDDAISKLDKLDESDYKDSTLIMQLLRDNLTLWTSSNDDAADEDDEN